MARRNNIVYITMLEQYQRSFKTIVMFVSESFVLFMYFVYYISLRGLGWLNELGRWI